MTEDQKLRDTLVKPFQEAAQSWPALPSAKAEVTAKASKRQGAKKQPAKVKGVFEKVPGSGVWWVRFTDAEGRRHREKAGAFGMAKSLLTLRNAEVMQGRKFPQSLRQAGMPTLSGFSQRFIDTVQIRNAAKPKTVEFYAQQMKRLLEFEPLANARLDAVDESLIESFVQSRQGQANRAGYNRKESRRIDPEKTVSPATVNRSLACLRRLLRLAQEWRVIDRVPRVHLLKGERNREFTLSHAQERLYLEMAPQPLRDFALLDVDTGLRVGEALALEWPDIRLEPANGAKFGYLHVEDGKSQYARRNVPLTGRVKAMLESRKADSKAPWVFSEDGAAPMLNSSLDHLHRELRATLKMPGGFVLHSLRHTYGTRLGEGGADAFSIMRLMGHSSVTISQRYVHPTPEALERAVERLETLNAKAQAALPRLPAPSKAFEGGREEDESAAVSASLKKNGRAVSGGPTATRTATGDFECL
jgi:integrase